MPHGEPQPDDPHVLVGVRVPAQAGALREMAAAFADEFAQMGFDRERILRLFRTPFYAGAHAALSALGEDEVGRLVEESVRVFGARARRPAHPDHSRGHVSGPGHTEGQAGVMNGPGETGGEPCPR